jgi:hypothetical protein
MGLKNGKVILVARLACLACRLTNVFTDAFPASQAFEDINAALTSSKAEQDAAIQQGSAIFAFTLKNKAGETDSWHIDLKNKGEVGRGLGEKPTGQ